MNGTLFYNARIYTPLMGRKPAAGAEQGKIAKYDYTSYDDAVPYYTMIAYEEKKPVKLLLDLNEEFLLALKSSYPEKVFR